MATKNKIKFNNYQAPDRTSVYTLEKNTYKVRLYFKHLKRFTNKKEVDKYLSEASKLITLSFYELNYLMIDIYRLYRESWIYIESVEQRNKLDAKFYSCGQLFNRFDNNSGILGNFNTFDKYFKVIDNLKEITNELHQVEKDRIKSEPFKVNILSNQIKSASKTVQDFLKA